MTWFKVDDKLHSHRKVAALGPDVAAMALWVVAGSWSADHLTDGWVPRYMVPRLLPVSKARAFRFASALETVQLWDQDVRENEPGWQFHGWNERGRQPLAERVIADREANAQRQAEFLERKRASHNGVTNGVINGVHNEAPTRPDPTVLPTEAQTPMHAEAQPGLFPASDVPFAPPAPDPMERFAEFYKVYPRHVAPGRAEKAWATAVKLASPGLIIDAARVFAMERKFSDKKLIPHPATWLNDRRWEDEPDPEYGPPAPSLTAEGALALPGVPQPATAPSRPFNGYAQRPATYDQRAAQADAALASLQARHGIHPTTPAADFGETFRRI